MPKQKNFKVRAPASESNQSKVNQCSSFNHDTVRVSEKSTKNPKQMESPYFMENKYIQFRVTLN